MMYTFSHIKITECTVIPIPLFHVLDGKTTTDYVARVEPSCTGGRKIAEYLLDAIEHSGIPSKIHLQKPENEIMERMEIINES